MPWATKHSTPITASSTALTRRPPRAQPIFFPNSMVNPFPWHPKAPSPDARASVKLPNLSSIFYIQPKRKCRSQQIVGWLTGNAHFLNGQRHRNPRTQSARGRGGTRRDEPRASPLKEDRRSQGARGRCALDVREPSRNAASGDRSTNYKIWSMAPAACLPATRPLVMALPMLLPALGQL